MGVRYGRSSCIFYPISFLDGQCPYRHLRILHCRIRACPACAFSLSILPPSLLGYLKIKSCRFSLILTGVTWFGQRKMSLSAGTTCMNKIWAVDRQYFCQTPSAGSSKSFQETRGLHASTRDVMLFAENAVSGCIRPGCRNSITIYRQRPACMFSTAPPYAGRKLLTPMARTYHFPTDIQGLPGLPVYHLLVRVSLKGRTRANGSGADPDNPEPAFLKEASGDFQGFLMASHIVPRLAESQTAFLSALMTCGFQLPISL